MKWTGLNELRELFLAFFESKEHLRADSYPLIPKDDNSLLLVNAGMAPLKKYFTGEAVPPSKRMTTSQKCIRTPDIERVGKTARHGTYFEMLGNFSFGDYFKKEATAWAWEFFTKTLEIPSDILYVSVYEEDEEAYDIWTKEVGVSESHMVRMGKEDNFWEHGTGPCGPCSEIYFDRGEKNGCGGADCKVGCDCDRFVEVWNLVFTQFDKTEDGKYLPLPKPNIDTGMGLERLACVMQGVDNLFLVDTVRKILNHASEISGVSYGASDKQDISLRVITDHIRSCTFMIADGVIPSNEGRGYVLRRLLRRAARHGRMLSIVEPFLYKICDTVINENKSAYPELSEKKDFIKKMVDTEEKNFARTIEGGLHLLDELMVKSIDILSGGDVFKLYDTFGFPMDLTADIAAEKGIKIDEKGFNELMKKQRERARKVRKQADIGGWDSDDGLLKGFGETKFLGYENLSVDAKILAIISEKEKQEAISEGTEAAVILDTTSFYASSGGQVGDTGLIITKNAAFKVVNTTKTHDGTVVHTGVMERGIINVGDDVKANVDRIGREATMRNHTAAHLLQAALRQVLGNHVQQAGQHVDPLHLRFDFTHFSAVTPDELVRIESVVNKAIMSASHVTSNEMSLDEAKKIGAMALFGEKYGDSVRVVTAAESSELCGGTHVLNTGNIGLVRILSESSVASGVRRIEAVTGFEVINYMDEQRSQLTAAANALKLSAATDLPKKIAALLSDLKTKEHDIEVLRNELSAGALGNLLINAIDVGKCKLITARFDNKTTDEVRAICDKIKSDIANGVAVIAAVNKEKNNVTFCGCCGHEAVKKGVHAGNIIKAVAERAGGSGGGRPDSAMAGGKDVSKTDEALSVAKAVLESQLG